MNRIMPKGFTPPEPARPKMPPEIAKAIATVMGAVHAVSKDKENTQGGYKYASVDQFYEAIRAPMAAAGFFTIADEISVVTAVRETVDRYNNKKSSTWMTCVYHIWLHHESGVEHGPYQREITVVASGPQASAAAESFVTKYFLRNLFKIATGDMDVDAMPQEVLPARDERSPRDVNEDRPNDTTGQTRWSGKEGANAETRRKLDASEYALSCIAELRKVTTTREDLAKWWADNLPTMQGYFSSKDDPLYVSIKEAFREHGSGLPVTPDPPPANAPPIDPPPAQQTVGEKATDDRIPF